jgi:Bacterial SH3 domain
VPAGRRRKTLPQRARLQRWGALGVTVLVAAAVVVPVASALDRTARATWTPVASERLARVARVAPHTVSRDYQRPEATAVRVALANRLLGVTATERVSHVTLRTRWVTAPLNVLAAPAESARRLAVLRTGDTVGVTGKVRGAWAQVRHGGRLAWVHRAYLSATKPSSKPGFARAVSGSVSGAPCPDGSSVESGLVTHTIEVYRAVCAAFPAVTRWGGRSGDGGDHATGHALDIMCTGSLGDAIAAYVRAHASKLGVSYVIWSQHIWSVQRSSEGWRAMPDRGSTTANHYDHVHVSVY